MRNSQGVDIIEVRDEELTDTANGEVLSQTSIDPARDVVDDIDDDDDDGNIDDDEDDDDDDVAFAIDDDNHERTSVVVEEEKLAVVRARYWPRRAEESCLSCGGGWERKKN